MKTLIIIFLMIIPFLTFSQDFDLKQCKTNLDTEYKATEKFKEYAENRTEVSATALQFNEIGILMTIVSCVSLSEKLSSEQISLSNETRDDIAKIRDLILQDVSDIKFVLDNLKMTGTAKALAKELESLYESYASKLTKILAAEPE